MNEFYPYSNKKQILSMHMTQAIKTIQIINQLIPLIIQIKPLLVNLNNAMNIIAETKTIKDEGIAKEKHDQLPKNMV